MTLGSVFFCRSVMHFVMTSNYPTVTNLSTRRERERERKKRKWQWTKKLMEMAAFQLYLISELLSRGESFTINYRWRAYLENRHSLARNNCRERERGHKLDFSGIIKSKCVVRWHSCTRTIRHRAFVLREWLDKGKLQKVVVFSGRLIWRVAVEDFKSNISLYGVLDISKITIGR